MSDLIDENRAWGRSMLREFAAKQQLVPMAHMFGATIGTADMRQLRALAAAIRAIDDGLCDGEALRRLLRCEGDAGSAGAMLRAATPTLNTEEAGFALALAYLPFEVPDAFAANALRRASLKRIAALIDPRAALTPRTRLFVAQQLAPATSLDRLVAATASVAALRDNSAQADHAELCAPEARDRLRRLGAATEGWLADKAAFAAALQACLAHDWPGAQAQAAQVAARAGIAIGDADPPALADLLLISLLPSCDTIDAVKRLTAASRSSTSRARAAAE
ncbi:hypothetical protein RPB_2072 [Rhodopseudomonas palustris HaA2]|uniref:Uncharacterized protein n=1 Tax=Rhodopseudomonas palustris (strain HaA2) TaxID=316058 RepID=Q2IYD2_RHOP2|nr:hypothetical protein RPB_2072 [Rhodopseudomonas palustris HaA2]